METESTTELEPPPGLSIVPQVTLTRSGIEPTTLGIFCQEDITEGQQFGPFEGERVQEAHSGMDPSYVWEIVDLESKEHLWYIDATDPSKGNWMRYIKSARFYEEQNIVSEQVGTDIMYKAIKDISHGEELLTWYERVQLKKTRRKRKHLVSKEKSQRPQQNSMDKKLSDEETASVKQLIDEGDNDEYTPPRKLRRDTVSSLNGARVPRTSCRRRSVKHTTFDAPEDENASDSDETIVDENGVDLAVEADVEQEVDRSPTTTDDTTSSEHGYYQFTLKAEQEVKNSLGKKVFKCDICSGVYRHSFSLKRHYIRNHINPKYLSPADILNCCVSSGVDVNRRGSVEVKVEDSGKDNEVNSSEAKDESVKGLERRLESFNQKANQRECDKGKGSQLEGVRMMENEVDRVKDNREESVTECSRSEGGEGKTGSCKYLVVNTDTEAGIGQKDSPCVRGSDRQHKHQGSSHKRCGPKTEATSHHQEECTRNRQVDQCETNTTRLAGARQTKLIGSLDSRQKEKTADCSSTDRSKCQEVRKPITDVEGADSNPPQQNKKITGPTSQQADKGVENFGESEHQVNGIPESRDDQDDLKNDFPPCRECLGSQDANASEECEESPESLALKAECEGIKKKQKKMCELFRCVRKQDDSECEDDLENDMAQPRTEADNLGCKMQDKSPHTVKCTNGRVSALNEYQRCTISENVKSVPIKSVDGDMACLKGSEVKFKDTPSPPCDLGICTDEKDKTDKKSRKMSILKNELDDNQNSEVVNKELLLKKEEVPTRLPNMGKLYSGVDKARICSKVLDKKQLNSQVGNKNQVCSEVLKTEQIMKAVHNNEQVSLDLFNEEDLPSDIQNNDKPNSEVLNREQVCIAVEAVLSPADYTTLMNHGESPSNDGARPHERASSPETETTVNDGARPHERASSRGTETTVNNSDYTSLMNHGESPSNDGARPHERASSPGTKTSVNDFELQQNDVDCDPEKRSRSVSPVESSVGILYCKTHSGETTNTNNHRIPHTAAMKGTQCVTDKKCCSGSGNTEMAKNGRQCVIDEKCCSGSGNTEMASSTTDGKLNREAEAEKPASESTDDCDRLKPGMAGSKVQMQTSKDTAAKYSTNIKTDEFQLTTPSYKTVSQCEESLDCKTDPDLHSNRSTERTCDKRAPRNRSPNRKSANIVKIPADSWLVTPPCPTSSTSDRTSPLKECTTEGSGENLLTSSQNSRSSPSDRTSVSIEDTPEASVKILPTPAQSSASRTSDRTSVLKEGTTEVSAESSPTSPDCAACFSSYKMSVVKEYTTTESGDSSVTTLQSSTHSALEEASPVDGGTAVLVGLFRCNMCENVFNSATQLKDHIQHHPGNTDQALWSCDRCDMKFKQKKCLMRHQAVHSKKVTGKSRECRYCGKYFSTLKYLKRHERSHETVHHTCEHCATSFTQAVNLKKHILRTHPTCFHPCAFCPKYFSAKRPLQEHLVSHGKSLKDNKREAARKQDEIQTIDPELDKAKSLSLAKGKSGKKDDAYEYACTVCEKPFLDYTNMCRHRSLAHHQKESHPTEVVRAKPRYSIMNMSSASASIIRTRARAARDSEEFYTQVAQNVQGNLTNHMMGTFKMISHAEDIIKWDLKRCKGNSSFEPTFPKKDKNSFVLPISVLGRSNFPKSYRMLDPWNKYRPTSRSVGRSYSLLPRFDNDQDAPKTDDNVEKQTTFDAGIVTQVSGVDVIGCQLCHSVFHRQEDFELHVSETHPLHPASTCRAPLPVKGNTDIHLPISLQYSKLEQDCVVDLSQSQPREEALVAGSGTHVVVSPGTECTDTLGLMSSECKQVASKPSVPAVCTEDPAERFQRFLCKACYQEFSDWLDLRKHKEESHPTIEFDYTILDQHLKQVWYNPPKPVGLLNVMATQLPEQEVLRSQSYKCTKCGKRQKDLSDLHTHIMECADPESLRPKYVWVYQYRKHRYSKMKQKRTCEWQKNTLKKGALAAEPNGALDSFMAKTNESTDSVFLNSDGNFDLFDDVKKRRRRPFELLYNPNRHTRRREMAEVVTTAICGGCNVDYNTISMLERHIPSCTHKEKIRELESLKSMYGADSSDSSSDTEDYDPSKHLCIYCLRQFTYLGSLRNHVFDVCSVRKEFVKQDEYLDQEWEDELIKKTGGRREPLSRHSSLSSIAGNLDLDDNSQDSSSATAAADTKRSDADRKLQRRKRRGFGWAQKNKGGNFTKTVKRVKRADGYVYEYYIESEIPVVSFDISDTFILDSDKAPASPAESPKMLKRGTSLPAHRPAPYVHQSSYHDDNETTAQDLSKNGGQNDEGDNQEKTPLKNPKKQRKSMEHSPVNIVAKNVKEKKNMENNKTTVSIKMGKEKKAGKLVTDVPEKPKKGYIRGPYKKKSNAGKSKKTRPYIKQSQRQENPRRGFRNHRMTAFYGNEVVNGNIPTATRDYCEKRKYKKRLQTGVTAIKSNHMVDLSKKRSIKDILKCKKTVNILDKTVGKEITAKNVKKCLKERLAQKQLAGKTINGRKTLGLEDFNGQGKKKKKQVPGKLKNMETNGGEASKKRKTWKKKSVTSFTLVAGIHIKNKSEAGAHAEKQLKTKSDDSLVKDSSAAEDAFGVVCDSKQFDEADLQKASNVEKRVVISQGGEVPRKKRKYCKKVVQSPVLNGESETDEDSSDITLDQRTKYTQSTNTVDKACPSVKGLPQTLVKHKSPVKPSYPRATPCDQIVNHLFLNSTMAQSFKARVSPAAGSRSAPGKLHYGRGRGVTKAGPGSRGGLSVGRGRAKRSLDL